MFNPRMWKGEVSYNKARQLAMLSNIVMVEYLRPIWTKMHENAFLFRKNKAVISKWWGHPAYRGIETLDNDIFQKCHPANTIIKDPSISKKIFKYHADFIYLDEKFFEWYLNCKGHTEVFYRELPKSFYKVFDKVCYLRNERHYASLIEIPRKYTVFYDTLMKYSTYPHKTPTHIDKKFYNWLNAMCTQLLLLGG